MRSPESSHFIFWNEGYEKNITLKKRSLLLPNQMRMLEEVVKNYEQDEKTKDNKGLDYKRYKVIFGDRDERRYFSRAFSFFSY